MKFQQIWCGSVSVYTCKFQRMGFTVKTWLALQLYLSILWTRDHFICLFMAGRPNSRFRSFWKPTRNMKSFNHRREGNIGKDISIFISYLNVMNWPVMFILLFIKCKSLFPLCLIFVSINGLNQRYIYIWYQ